MRTVAFFSYKGGNGRTLTAANFAVYLSKLGLKVVIMDFDLDAPGVDSKFADFALPKGQRGLIDYVLQFQREGGPPGPIDEIYCSIPIESPRADFVLGLIPAGDYLSGEYPAKLNELNWSTIFSPQRDGVAFFQLFLRRIEKELGPDVLIIDSRTGFSEIGGLCTQQLADETVILSSMARESIKMTRHLARVIHESEIAKQLNKKIETRIVVCRVPKPKDVDKLKARCCKLFEVDETQLFFLFSCKGLEQDEFVAMLDTRKEESLVSNYVQLFQGLKVEIAQKNIHEEIERTEKGLLACTPDEADTKIREMAALYPHTDVYRRAMRYFVLRRREDEASLFGMRLLDLLPEDAEAHLQVARFILEQQYFVVDRNLRLAPRSVSSSAARRFFEMLDGETVVTILEHAYATGQLSAAEQIRMADILEDLERPDASFRIVKNCLDTCLVEDSKLRTQAVGIAARTSMALGMREEALQYVSDLPVSALRGELVNLAIQAKVDANDKKGAFDIAKLILTRDLYPPAIEMAVRLAEELGRRSELEQLIRAHPGLRKGQAVDPELVRILQRSGFDMSEVLEESIARRHWRDRQ